MPTVEDQIEYMTNHPQEVMARYPHYREQQRELANAFWLGLMQQEDPEIRRKVENGLSKRCKVFVDVAWDADAYNQWKQEEDVRWRTALSMFLDLQPSNFMTLTQEERTKFFHENREKIDQALERVRQKKRYSTQAHNTAASRDGK